MNGATTITLIFMVLFFVGILVEAVSVMNAQRKVDYYKRLAYGPDPDYKMPAKDAHEHYQRMVLSCASLHYYMESQGRAIEDNLNVPAEFIVVYRNVQDELRALAGRGTAQKPIWFQTPKGPKA